jgi:hypothetical protein
LTPTPRLFIPGFFFIFDNAECCCCHCSRYFLKEKRATSTISSKKKLRTPLSFTLFITHLLYSNCVVLLECVFENGNSNFMMNMTRWWTFFFCFGNRKCGAFSIHVFPFTSRITNSIYVYIII